MWKKSIKTLIFVFLIILFININLFTCEEDVDLDSEIVEEPSKRNFGTYDEEEFDNPKLLNQEHGKKGKPVGLQESIQTELPPLGEVAHHEVNKKLHFAFYEIIMVVVLITFLLNWFWGKKTNEALAQRWYMSNKEFMEENYAHIGVNTEYNTKAGVPMLKESYHNFKFYASGRMFIKWLMVNMEFKKRQDLVSLATSLFLFNEKDRLIYESSVLPVSDLPLVFCLCKKKDVKTLKKSYSDLDFFTQPYNSSVISDNLVLLTESDDILDQVFNNKEFLSLYLKIQPLIDMVYFTDRQTYTKEEHSFFFSFDINASRAAIDSDFSDLTLFVHMFIDLISTAKVTSTHKREGERLRIEFDKVRAKELQERNAEEVRQKKQEKINGQPKKSMTVEQAQKNEEKEKKEQLRLQKKKQMKVVKK